MPLRNDCDPETAASPTTAVCCIVPLGDTSIL